MFTKLLVIKIVASKRWGLSSSLFRYFFLLVFPSLIVMQFDGEREKHATSEPEINADIPSKINITNKARMTFALDNWFIKKISLKIKSGKGAVSKRICV